MTASPRGPSPYPASEVRLPEGRDDPWRLAGDGLSPTVCLRGRRSHFFHKEGSDPRWRETMPGQDLPLLSAGGEGGEPGLEAFPACPALGARRRFDLLRIGPGGDRSDHFGNGAEVLGKPCKE